MGLLEKQEEILHSLARALGNFKKLGKNNYTPAKIRSRIASLKETWRNCLDTHAAILHAYPTTQRTGITYFDKVSMDTYEDEYLTALDYMSECLEELEPNISLQSSNTSTPIRHESTSLPLQHLPPIQLPPFSGKIEEWESFRDRFEALIVKNKDLSAFSRMHFLSASLTGRAREVISHLSVTAENFSVAWEALSKRFENKRRLIETHVASLYNLPTLSRESASDMHVLRDKTGKAIAALKRLERTPENMLNDILVYFVTQKLDPSTRRAWKLKFDDEDEPPTYDQLSNFLSSRAIALDELGAPAASKINRSSKVTSANASTTTISACPLCQKHHFINKCKQFLDKSPSQRRDLVKQHNRCFNCLSFKHAVSDCRSPFSCRSCQRKHHSLLHVDTLSSSNTTLATASESEPRSATEIAQATTLTAGLRSAVPRSVLLATAKVRVSSLQGRCQIVRALLDQGSEVSFMTERLAQLLHLPRVRTFTSISAVFGVKAEICRYASNVLITPRDSSTPKFTTLAFIMKSLTNYLPPRRPSDIKWSHLSALNLADDNPTSHEPIDLLIGADLYSQIILEGVRKGPIDQPIAQNSHLGWLLSGPTSVHGTQKRSINAFHCSLDTELRRFWELEELPSKTILSPEERRCEEHFIQTHTRSPDGRYIVRLPFKDGPLIDIGESRNTATRLLTALNRRLASRPDLKQEYGAFLAEYEKMGHMEKVSSMVSSQTQVCFIPHHAVIKQSSFTTRVRVVFNASSVTSNGTSLNHHLMTGPKLQTELFDVLLRWRQYQYVYTADIAKMYRQIWVDERDQDYQRIVWSGDSNAEEEYRLRTVTYGTAAAPYLALRVLNQLVQDEGSSLPLASPILRDNIYIDDVLFGAEDIPLLRRTREQVSALLLRGGFQLRKWASNKSDLLQDIPSDDHGLACSRSLQPHDSVSVLGITWNPSLDVFQFHSSPPNPIPNTKRLILSTIAKLFDPLGWATPVTIAAKIFMQQLWRLKFNWDDIIPDSTLAKWKLIHEKLSKLDSIQLPRWTNQGADTLQMELHGFSDASNVAYAAVVYLRVTTISGHTFTTLLASKSKVAPLKLLSIPRLELSAAVLLARLMDAIYTVLKRTNIQCYCWTDSTVTLAWLSQHPSHWNTFVSHRVESVQSRIPYAKWRHVPTKDNPADCASRGLLNADLHTHSLWWQGPLWLRFKPSEWPIQPVLTSRETTQEVRTVAANFGAADESWDLASKYSTWPKLLKVTAYIMRFITRCRPQSDYSRNRLTSKALSADEIQRAKIYWINTIQRELFPDELKALRKKKALLSKSPILSLDPYLDEDKVIRVGGRIKLAPLPTQIKNPIILAQHPIVTMIMQYTHLRSLHAGLQLTLATLRREFWVLRARTLIRSIIHRCVTCTRERAAVPDQLMGQLPRARVSAPSRAFLHSGVDYAGLIATRTSPGRGLTSRKSYIAVFICLASRAVHLELVSSYSTSSFLDAYTRFCSRRGIPEAMYSDNGTTFTGADKELTKAYQTALREPNFLNRTAVDKVAWHFIPPHAPHFGGLWEAGVRSVKHHLRRLVGAHTLTFEEITTLLCRIEACLNSRPLGPLTDSPDDYDALTPGHFLVGSTLTVNPEPSLLHLKENRLSRWQLIRHVTERFWRVWQTDYINTLQQRSKWRRVKPSIQVGTMVLIRNAHLPPCKWELGRVTRCHEGSDGLVRVISVKTTTSEYKRPISQLCILPIDINLQNKQ